MTAFQSKNQRASARSAAFSLMEALFGMVVLGMVFLALYGGMLWSNSMQRLARENLRATQILVEAVESIRLCKWEQITTSGFIPTNFYAPYVPAPHLTNGFSTTPLSPAECGGVVYEGQVRIEPVPYSSLDAVYTNDLRKITVELTWQMDGARKTRSACTYVSRYGIQNYFFN